MFDWNDALTAFEVYRAPDAALAAAYEHMSDQDRAWLKQTQALVHWYWGEQSETRVKERRSETFGLAARQHSQPVPWVLVAISKRFAAAARLSAALLVARLSGVHNIIAVVDSTDYTTHAAVSVALELAGIEHIFACADTACLHIAKTLCLHGQGRFLLFGQPVPSTTFFPLAHTHGIPVWEDRMPHILLQPETKHCETLVRQAHPDAVLHFNADKKQHPQGLNAEINNAHQQHSDAPLLLTPPLAGCWLHTDLRPMFFHNYHVSLMSEEGDT